MGKKLVKVGCMSGLKEEVMNNTIEEKMMTIICPLILKIHCHLLTLRLCVVKSRQKSRFKVNNYVPDTERGRIVQETLTICVTVKSGWDCGI